MTRFICSYTAGSMFKYSNDKIQLLGEYKRAGDTTAVVSRSQRSPDLATWPHFWIYTDHVYTFPLPRNTMPVAAEYVSLDLEVLSLIFIPFSTAQTHQRVIQHISMVFLFFFVHAVALN